MVDWEVFRLLLRRSETTRDEAGIGGAGQDRGVSWNKQPDARAKRFGLGHDGPRGRQQIISGQISCRISLFIYFKGSSSIQNSI